MSTLLRLASVLLALFNAAPSAATTARDICGDPIPDPCVVDTPHTVDDGSTIELGGGALVLRTSAGRLEVGTGAMTIRAGSVTLETGAKLLGDGGRIIVETSGSPGSITVQAGARIDVSAAGGGGAIDLDAEGDILADGDLSAVGTAGTAVGGAIHVTADGDVVLGNLAASGGDAFPVDPNAVVSVSAGGALTVQGLVDVSHGECFGCSVDLVAGGDIRTDRINARGTGTGGDGGSVTLTAGGSIVIGNDVLVQGGGGGGGGGDITAEAARDVLLNGSLLLGGTSPDGDGGGVDITAGRDLAQASGSVVDATGGGTGCGGAPNSMTGGRDVVLRVVNVSGGSCDAGTFEATAGRDLTILGTISANAEDDGNAGEVSAVAGGTLAVGADVRANGASAGAGGSVHLEGCDLTVGPGVQVLAHGPDGDNELVAHGQLNIEGTLEAGDANDISFGDDHLPPVISGAVRPPATPALDPTLLPCGQAADCGNGTVEGREECDDGNTDSCDGCSASCERELCGNGRLDCGEACDPPDGLRCDASCRSIASVIQRLPGSSSHAGCEVEWELAHAKGELNPSNGLPERAQRCADGDPACDADGANDDECTFRARLCLRVVDPRLPCSPAALDFVSVRQPRPLTPRDSTDAANAEALVGALGRLGVTVKAGTAVIVPGAPDTQLDHCTESFTLRVPHGTTIGRRRFNVAAEDGAGLRMTSNALKLECVPSAAVCGDGALDGTEQCEDGNTAGCDGCSATCHLEACGNGILDCGEQCDHGVFNGAADGCTAGCKEVGPALRIPGGGARSIDCGLEWAPALNPARIALDRRGLPRNRQACVDNDPACDRDPARGSCRLEVFACLGGGDARLGCAPARVTGVDVVRPSASAAAGAALARELQDLGFPAGPGESCTGSVPVDVPAGTQLRFTTRTHLATGATDSDSLKLKCLAAP